MDNKKVRDAQLLTALAYQGKVKIEIQLEGGNLYQNVFTHTREDAQHIVARLFKVGIHPVALKQQWTFTGIQR